MHFSETSEKKAVHVFAHGRVQGVGFRSWTAQAARSFGITGWVRNCPDYSVEIFAEGHAAALSGFLTAVNHEHPRAHVTQFTVTEATCQGYKSFEIRY